MERKRIAARLDALPTEVFFPRRSDTYADARPWLDNALAEHGVREFRAIITPTPTGQEFVLDAETVDEGHHRWRVEPGRQIARDPAAVAGALRLLLRASKRIAIVDPYFRADQSEKADAVRALCAVVEGHGATIEIHCGTAAMSYAELARIGQRALPSVLPRGTTAVLHILKADEGDPRFHNRYVLTEVGGVQFGDSIERGGAGDQDRLSILGAVEHAILWAQLCGERPTFKRAGESITATGQLP